MIGLVVDAIPAFVVEVKHIPGRCTGLCHPVDGRMNKPLKVRTQKKWVKWMIGVCLQKSTIPPSHAEVANWICEAHYSINPAIDKSWNRTECSWFDKYCNEYYMKI